MVLTTTRILLTIIFCFSILWNLKVLVSNNYPDFNTQYYVPHLVFSGIDPFSSNKYLFTPQVYPPTSLFFFMPFSLINFEIAAHIYTIGSIISLLFSLFILSRIFKTEFFGKTNLILMTFVMIFFPVKFTLGMGQVNNYILLFLTLGLFFISRNKEIYSGIFFGLAIVIKFFPLLALPYFLIIKKTGILIGIFITFLLSIFLVLFFVPMEVTINFFKIFPDLVSSWKLDYYNQSLGGFIGRIFGVNSASVLIKNFMSLLFILITLIIVVNYKSKNMWGQLHIIGIIINLNLIINTFSWQHHFVWMIIPFYSTFYFVLYNNLSKINYWVLLFSYILIAGNISNPLSLPILFQSHVFYGAVLLFILQIRLLDKSRRNEFFRKV